MSQEKQSNEQRPEIPFAGVVYGDTIYWGTILSAVVAVIGQVISFLTPDSKISPAILLSRIWEGEKVAGVWQGTGIDRPSGDHWYLSYLTTGEGLAMFGMALGVFVVIPAILASAWVMFTREKWPFFGVLAVIAALITVGSFLGVIPMPVG
ncbi:hypothetical protein AN478_09905 [Thiohalorhabdus denitrificans]|uniref:Uncharacterized protein n=1 Tax=Thiohalorhabdus denitrificans TaxID=381306 RepID=A0A0P9GHI4_9GAMM|nr:hypothetical protein [Thiohalorhabdus denitrificans]KPV39473.1 hypothetical protein AN478_09905 [Thiohalorhabdus denitrificans]SCY01629.1 hypothetical protein SAMN05661077_1056 [Thiohalorhabdus denitrificans]